TRRPGPWPPAACPAPTTGPPPRPWSTASSPSTDGPISTQQAAQKGPDARRRPKAAGEAYSLYVEPAVEGANEADGPFSAACLGALGFRGGLGARGHGGRPTTAGRRRGLLLRQLGHDRLDEEQARLAQRPTDVVADPSRI